MAIRWDDAARTATLSVRDLVELGGRKGHVVRSLLLGSTKRMALGFAIHQGIADERMAEDAAYRPEVRLVVELTVDGPTGPWTVRVMGRVDGLVEEDGRTRVEEVKSTALSASRLYGTRLDAFPEFVAQVEVYLWMLGRLGHAEPEGRLVLASIVDGSRHVLGVPGADLSWVERALRWVVLDRARRSAWLVGRMGRTIPWPFADYRPGQLAVRDGVIRGLQEGTPVFVEAPTGSGKTAAVLVAALTEAFRQKKQLYWATARTTQQLAVEAAVDRLVALGLPLRRVTLGSRARACINGVVACHPDRCGFAQSYLDKLRDGDLVGRYADGRHALESLRTIGRSHEVCPHELSFELLRHVDVVIGDYNHVFEPPSRALAGDPSDWIVVVDEAHQLVPRARGYGSPAVDAPQITAAKRHIAAQGAKLQAFADLCAEIEDRVDEAELVAEGPIVAGDSPAAISPRAWRDLADRVEELAIDWAVLGQERETLFASREEGPDPWVVLGRSVQRVAEGLVDRPETRVPYARLVPRERAVGLLELDPSQRLGSSIAALGGYVAVSATLRPFDVERRLQGLGRTIEVSVPSPFPPENRRVILVPRVSTRYKDRASQTEPTAILIEQMIRQVPGNVAVFFSSFEMLRTITSRWELDRPVLRQEPSMSDDDRTRMLAALAASGRAVRRPPPPAPSSGKKRRRKGQPAGAPLPAAAPSWVPSQDARASAVGVVVLAAVLGGIFAEGIDLPPGALRAVIVCGPALPPPSLEQTLLHAYHEDHDGDGFLYASLVPGLRRVVQAAGRLIRRPEDRGVIALVDARFRWRQIRELLPPDWEPDVPDDPVEAMADFYAEDPA